MTQTQANTDKLCNFICQKFEDGELDNDSLVQIIELCGGYLNLETIPNYAKKNNLSYNGVKKHRKICTIFKVKFVIDNE
ncbi:MAG: hypothetical protein J0M25_00750 [Flavobacteriales bacterium]|nr:hypothetical protein [Flavobacteriales bacterium]